MRTEVKETVRRRGERDKRGHSGKPGKRDSGVERREKRQARDSGVERREKRQAREKTGKSEFIGKRETREKRQANGERPERES